MKYYVGCSGWRNVSWKTDFYPITLDAKDYLSYYSNRFDFVEVNLGDGTRQMNADSTRIDSTYGFLSRYARIWAEQTPDDFHFAIGIPKAILFPIPDGTSNLAGGSVSSVSPDNIRLGEFLEKLGPIREKVLTLSIDVPANLTLGMGREWLESVLTNCAYHGYSAAMQFNNSSWFQDLTYNILKRHGASVCWPYDLNRPLSRLVVTANFTYLRPRNNEYSGSNNFADNMEGSKQKLSDLIDAIKEQVKEERALEYAIIVTSHPAQANLIHDILKLPKNPGSFVSSVPFAMTNSSGNSVDDNDRTNFAGLIGGHSPAESISDRIIICVDLNAFYPSCEELRNPSLKGKAHAVIMTDQKEGSITKGVVSSCSYEARKYGVKSAMGLSRALLMCPEMILLPVDISYYSKVSDQVMSVLQPFADVLEQASIDEAFLDCSSKIKEKAGVTALEQFGMSIKQAVKEKCGGLLCSVGIAPTKSTAKIASDYRKPDGLTVVLAGQVKTFLLPLEVNRVAGIGQKTEQALKEMGIRTLAQLASIDVQKLQDRFGKNGYWMWRVANGIEDEPVQQRGDHVSLSTETTLESFTRGKEEIRRLLISLADEIYQRARENGYSFRTVAIKLVRTDFSIETRETTFSEERDDKNSIITVIEPLLEKFTLSDKEPAVRKVGVRLMHLSRRDLVPPKHIGARQYFGPQKTILDYT